MTVRAKVTKRPETGKTGHSARQEHKVGRAKAKAASPMVHVTKRGNQKVYRLVEPHGKLVEVITKNTPTLPPGAANDRRTSLMENEGYDPQFMFEALKKTPVPTQKEWTLRVSRAAKALEKATNAPFLNKYRLVES